MDLNDDAIENNDGNAANDEEDEDYILVGGDNDEDDEIKYVPPPRQALAKNDGNVSKVTKISHSHPNFWNLYETVSSRGGRMDCEE